MSTGKKSRVFIFVDFVWERRGVCLDLEKKNLSSTVRVSHDGSWGTVEARRFRAS